MVKREQLEVTCSGMESGLCGFCRKERKNKAVMWRKELRMWLFVKDWFSKEEGVVMEETARC